MPQGKQVGRNSQGEIHLCRMIRKVLAHLNGSQGQRVIRRRVATNVKSNARLKKAMLITYSNTARVAVDIRRRYARKVYYNV